RPGARLTCRSLVFTSGKARTRAFRMTRRGRWRVEVRVSGHPTRSTIAAGVPAAATKRSLPTLLATGDSTMDGLSGFLSDALGDDSKVVSEVEPGLGMSRADELQPRAVEQAKRLRPSTTIMSI